MQTKISSRSAACLGRAVPVKVMAVSVAVAHCITNIVTPAT